MKIVKLKSALKPLSKLMCLVVIAFYPIFSASGVVIDQINKSVNIGYSSLSNNGGFGQEFVPTSVNHVGIRIAFIRKSEDVIGNAMLQIREDTITGDSVPGSIVTRDLLVSSPDVSAGLSFQWFDFLFDDLITLSLNRMYVVDIVIEGERLSIAAFDRNLIAPEAIDPYPYGRSIWFNTPDNLSDITFQTLVIPEVHTVSVLGIMFAGMLTRKRSCKSSR